MNALLAFFPRPEGGTAKVPREWAEASDWFVIFTMATLFFLLGAFVTWAWVIWRRSTKPEPHVRLLMELEDEKEREKHAATASEEPESRAPWEKSADWWKRTED